MKKGNWFGDDLIEFIVLEGCYVVLVVYKYSFNLDIEWRIFFVVIEKRMVRNVVIDG